MRAIFESPWVSIPVRIFLGCVFIYSAGPKILDPPGFAEATANYQILPSFLINPSALVLPWLELFAGFSLVVGVLRRGSALMVAVLLLFFIAALSIDLYRGIAVDCGCFSIANSQKTFAELALGMKLDVLRDLGLILLAVHCFLSPVTWLKPNAA
jgi:putative oxidoreductase